MNIFLANKTIVSKERTSPQPENIFWDWSRMPSGNFTAGLSTTLPLWCVMLNQHTPSANSTEKKWPEKKLRENTEIEIQKKTEAEKENELSRKTSWMNRNKTHTTDGSFSLSGCAWCYSTVVQWRFSAPHCESNFCMRPAKLCNARLFPGYYRFLSLPSKERRIWSVLPRGLRVLVVGSDSGRVRP